MNSLFFATFLCLGALASAHYIGHDDGSYKGEGLAESQDHGQYDHGYAVGAYAPALYSAGLSHYAVAPAHYAGVYAHGAAPIGADGRVVDTPEVAHAKAAHFAAKAAAGHGAHGVYAPLAYASAPAHYAGVYAHGAAPIGADGRVVDTPEVAHAKIAHFAAISGASHGAYSPLAYSATPSHYAGVYAHGAAPIGADGRVVDTPEVAHAKAAHFAAKAAAGHGAHGVYAPLAYASAPAHYSGVYAHGAAPIGADGRVVDTPEVAHAKIAHFAAVSGASHGAYSPLAYSATPAHYAGVYAHGAAPIGADGRVVDTPEVAHAKAAHFAAKAAAGHGAHGVYAPLAYAVAPAHYAGVYAHGAAPLGHDRVVVDTPEVAHAKAAHHVAFAAAAHGAHHYGYAH